jgi:hypothetical protein
MAASRRTAEAPPRRSRRRGRISRAPPGARNDDNYRSGGESAKDHALSVEGHIGLVGSHARIGHQLGPGVVARLLRRPFDPAEDDRLAVFGFDRAPKVGDLAIGTSSPQPSTTRNAPYSLNTLDADQPHVVGQHRAQGVPVAPVEQGDIADGGRGAG